MATRYETLGDLYHRAHQASLQRHEACVALASQLFAELLNSLGVPAQHQPAPNNALPALAACTVADGQAVDLGGVAIHDAVTTEDNENFRMGLLVRVYPQPAGYPAVSALFRVSFKHVRNDAFSVQIGRGPVQTTSASAPDRGRVLSAACDEVFEALQQYFAACVREQRPAPIGFQLIQ